MAEPVFLALCGGVVLGAIVLGYFTNKDRKLKRRLRKAPRRTIRHLPDRTWARFSGKVAPIARPLTSPLSGRACAFWRVQLLESAGKNSWRTVLEREAGQDFSIVDETGTLLVRVDGAKLAIVQDGRFNSGVGRDPTPELHRFLAEHGEKAEGWVFNRTLRYLEAVVEEGEQVTVAGVAHAEPDPDPQKITGGYRETPMRMVLHGTENEPVLITDDPGEATKR